MDPQHRQDHSELLKKVRTRPAEHHDCEGVMGINRNVYGGIDYLQWTFHKQASDPSRFPQVAELNGTIIGYQCNLVIEDGKTMVRESARITPELQGIGIISKISDACTAAAMAMFPQIERSMWTTVNWERVEYVTKKVNYIKILDRRDRVSFDASPENLRHLWVGNKFLDLLNQYCVESIKEIPQRLAIDMLSNQINFSMMGVNALMVNFEPWTINRSSFVTLMSLSTLHVMKCPKTGDITSLSFGSMMEIPLGVRYRCDFYGLPTFVTADVIISHVLYHIREITAFLTESPLSFSLSYPRHIDKGKISPILHSLGLHRTETPEDGGFILTSNLKDEQNAHL